MRKIKEYKILHKQFLCNLEKNVNEKIKEGYQPFGNLVYNIDYIQPIVMYEESFD